MVGWHHQLRGHKFEQTPIDREGQGSLHIAAHGVANSQTQLTDQNTARKKKASLVAHMVMSLPAMQGVQSLGQEDPQRREWLLTPIFLPEESTDGVAWRAVVHCHKE